MEFQENEIYGGFASVYDKFMTNIPYDEWFSYLKELLEEEDIREGCIVDLACGTGEITRRLVEAGYDVIGVDFSVDMLEVAREKCDSSVLLLHQDMRSLELYGTVEAIVCLCDGMNYLESLEDLQKVFQRAVRYLPTNGVFIFDLKTEFFYRDILGNRVFSENLEDASYIWENSYDQDTGKNEYLLTIYELVDDENDLFVRTDEIHTQTVFSIEEVQKCMEQSGLACAAVYEACTKKKPNEKTERVYFIGKKLACKKSENVL